MDADRLTIFINGMGVSNNVFSAVAGRGFAFHGKNLSITVYSRASYWNIRSGNMKQLMVEAFAQVTHPEWLFWNSAYHNQIEILPAFIFNMTGLEAI